MPRTCSATPGLMVDGTRAPITRLAVRIPPASWLGTKPSLSIRLRTLARVSAATLSGLLSARETVIGDTPSRAASSRMPTGLEGNGALD